MQMGAVKEIRVTASFDSDVACICVLSYLVTLSIRKTSKDGDRSIHSEGLGH
jgi:hypothetical protein